MTRCRRQWNGHRDGRECGPPGRWSRSPTAAPRAPASHEAGCSSRVSCCRRPNSKSPSGPATESSWPTVTSGGRSTGRSVSSTDTRNTVDRCGRARASAIGSRRRRSARTSSASWAGASSGGSGRSWTSRKRWRSGSVARWFGAASGPAPESGRSRHVAPREGTSHHAYAARRSPAPRDVRPTDATFARTAQRPSETRTWAAPVRRRRRPGRPSAARRARTCRPDSATPARR